MRITTVRRITQAFFLFLFLLLVVVTWFDRLGGYPVNLFLQIDPLVALATTLAAGTIYKALILSVFVIAIPTLLIGRFFCGWICPFGTLHHFVSWLARPGKAAERVKSNQYRRWHRMKYWILIAMLIPAAFGSVQIGYLDPICLFHRSVTLGAGVMWDQAVAGFNEMLGGAAELSWIRLAPVQQRHYVQAVLIGSVFLASVLANLLWPRFFCRALCPLGALLGVLSRFSVWRVCRKEARCDQCKLCRDCCPGACDPDTTFRAAECMVCFNCLDDCPHDAIAFAVPAAEADQIDGPQLSRRELIGSAVVGLTLYPLARAGGATDDERFEPTLIRPPGALVEEDFLQRCIKCGQCMRVCPTNVIQPALGEGGFEGLWTPVMNMRMGYCELNCVLCSQVCPTAALWPISIKEKHELPIRLGTAFVDRGRCLPWAMNRPCVVCEEVCPVSPKAIEGESFETVDENGQRVTLRRPVVKPDLCIGCGICQHNCPVRDKRAIYVTAVGETRYGGRSKRRLLVGAS